MKDQRAFIDYNSKHVLPDIDFIDIDPINYDETNIIHKKCISLLKEPDFKENIVEEKIKLDMLANLLEYAFNLLTHSNKERTYSLMYFMKRMGGYLEQKLEEYDRMRYVKIKSAKKVVDNTQ